MTSKGYTFGEIFDESKITIEDIFLRIAANEFDPFSLIPFIKLTNLSENQKRLVCNILTMKIEEFIRKQVLKNAVVTGWESE